MRSWKIGSGAVVMLGLVALSPAAVAQQGQPDYAQPPPAGQHYPGGIAARFAAANTTGDGRLTQAQAQAAGWTLVARHFGEIDLQHKGFVTRQDLRAFHQRMMAQRQSQSEGPPPEEPPQ